MTLHYILHIQITLVDGYNNTANTAHVFKAAIIEVCFSNILFNFLIKLYYLLCSCAKKQCVQVLSDNIFWAFECPKFIFEYFVFLYCILGEFKFNVEYFDLILFFLY